MSRRRKAAAVNLSVFAEQIAPVLASAHARLDSAGVSPAPPRRPWDQWLLDQVATPASPPNLDGKDTNR